jgi:hypothetical protein
VSSLLHLSLTEKNTVYEKLKSKIKIKLLVLSSFAQSMLYIYGQDFLEFYWWGNDKIKMHIQHLCQLFLKKISLSKDLATRSLSERRRFNYWRRLEISNCGV